MQTWDNLRPAPATPPARNGKAFHMVHPVLGVDHVFLLVDDLDASAARYRRLGFTLSPRGLHSAEKGTANYTVIFQHDYLELLGIVTETATNQHQRDMLAEDGEGLRAIACRIADAARARDALAALGIATTPISEFARPLPLPDGTEGLAAFAVTHFTAPDTPTGFMFMCQHKTPDMVWRPELKSHPNGARGLAGIVALANDTEALAHRFARLFAAGKVAATMGGHAVTTGADSARILCLNPAGAAARYSDDAVARTPARGFAALQIAVDDPAATARLLQLAGLSPQPGADGAVWVGPADAGGSIMEFVPA